jgi:hypothetical protein
MSEIGHAHGGVGLWVRIGRQDSTGRRSLWFRESKHCIELCSGREGDDAYVQIYRSNPQWAEIYAVLSSARFAAEHEDPDGMTLERELAASTKCIRCGGYVPAPGASCKDCGYLP